MTQNARGRHGAHVSATAHARTANRSTTGGRRSAVQKSNLAFLMEAAPKVPVQRAAVVAVAGVLVTGVGATAPSAMASGGPKDVQPASATSPIQGQSVSAAGDAKLSYDQLQASSKAAPAKDDAKPDDAGAKPGDAASSSDSVTAVNDPAGAQAFAASSLGNFGWGQDQMSCLTSLWTRESSWQTTAENPSSLAYGIAQSLPAEKMASVGADYRTNYKTQITWGLGYIKGRYGSPCGAWGHETSIGWY